MAGVGCRECRRRGEIEKEKEYLKEGKTRKEALPLFDYVNL